MNFTRTYKDQIVVAEIDPTVHEADVIWLKEWAGQYPAKVGAKVAGMTPNGFKKVQSGDSALGFEKMMTALRRDPELLAGLFVRCGGNLGMHPSQYAAIYRAINSITRGDFSE